ncbi:TetR/AcrR family transcriptional regulator [Phaeovulum vinaykumarii]|uniref:Transcriptional regulator, TetR family n=1 Tax=Phaeovulum vinaykumarii TaxID=407234 RepID=A0A1N7KE54_9RHOB|nr:TetR/AcrR family transcriptional regulator [Phaeovulum vinaykumarii]SIS59873.1 transcriptional regulator, TetR family [Phaeovulum vinaykumarii]SOB94261.1 TetR family transcriptional regulator [Phaeovulum vinaykumarii]
MPEDTSPSPRRRHAAGEDPAKREQILQGAMKEFLEKGFDAASMNEICRAAGVSKGTLYVYFADKADLFEALISDQREQMFQGIAAALESDLPLREKLVQFGRRLVEVLCSHRVIRAQRIVAATVDRMPEVGTRFYEGGALRSHAALLNLLRREAAAGRIDAPDLSLAAFQLMELVGAGLWRARLFGKRTLPPDPSEIGRAVESGVAMFLATYGTGRD